MDEYVLATIIWLYETIALGYVEPFYLADSHALISSRSKASRNGARLQHSGIDKYQIEFSYRPGAPLRMTAGNFESTWRGDVLLRWTARRKGHERRADCRTLIDVK